jgi:hypothetical protein
MFMGLATLQAQAQYEDSLLIRRIFDEALLRGRCYENLRVLCANGPRLSGSEGAAKAVQIMHDIMKKDGLEKVMLQPVMVPKWERGNVEKCEALIAGKTRKLNACALGGSVGTDGKWVKGTVVEIVRWSQLDSLGMELKNKIVFFNRPMDPRHIHTFSAYGACVDQRYSGAARAAKYGAKAVIVRSMSHKIDHHPHTGSMSYEDDVPKIPAMAISTADAEWLAAQLHQNKKPEVRLMLHCKSHPDVPSFNVVGELPGAAYSEIFLVGGHLDAWDNGDGAHDDGAGCVQSIEALRLLKAVGYVPKHTLRAVNFMNEENGLRGAKAYADSAMASGLKHKLAIESDRGGFSPRGFYVENSTAALTQLLRWKPLLEPYGLHDIKQGGGGADISPLKPQQTVLIGFVPDSQRYFDYHHAPSDTFDAINKRELELGAASLAALLYLYDKYGVDQ